MKILNGISIELLPAYNQGLYVYAEISDGKGNQEIWTYKPVLTEYISPNYDNMEDWNRGQSDFLRHLADFLEEQNKPLKSPSPLTT